MSSISKKINYKGRTAIVSVGISEKENTIICVRNLSDAEFYSSKENYDETSKLNVSEAIDAEVSKFQAFCDEKDKQSATDKDPREVWLLSNGFTKS